MTWTIIEDLGETQFKNLKAGEIWSDVSSRASHRTLVLAEGDCKYALIHRERFGVMPPHDQVASHYDGENIVYPVKVAWRP